MTDVTTRASARAPSPTALSTGDHSAAHRAFKAAMDRLRAPRQRIVNDAPTCIEAIARDAHRAAQAIDGGRVEAFRAVYDRAPIESNVEGEVRPVALDSPPADFDDLRDWLAMLPARQRTLAALTVADFAIVLYEQIVSAESLFLLAPMSFGSGPGTARQAIERARAELRDDHESQTTRRAFINSTAEMCYRIHEAAWCGTPESAMVMLLSGSEATLRLGVLAMALKACVLTYGSLYALEDERDAAEGVIGYGELAPARAIGFAAVAWALMPTAGITEAPEGVALIINESYTWARLARFLTAWWWRVRCALPIADVLSAVVE